MMTLWLSQRPVWMMRRAFFLLLDRLVQRRGVRYTHRIFDAQTRSIKEMYGIEAGEIDLPCFPLFGLFTLAQGMTVVIPDMDPTKPAEADPRLLLEAIRDQGCTNALLHHPFGKTWFDGALPMMKHCQR